MEEGERIRVECRDCGYREVVPTDGERSPADVIVEHGRETGHTLDTEVLE